MNKKNKRILICLITIVILIVFDQYTKNLAVNHLMNKEPVDLINGVLQFCYLPNGNTGAAFGMLQGQQWLFLLIAGVISLAMFVIIYNMPFDKKYYLLIVLMTLIISGGIGNMIDRIKQSYVVDFIYFYLIDFPIFNVADIYVSVGTALLVILIIFVYKEEDIKVLEHSVLAVFKKSKNKAQAEADKDTDK